MKFLITLLMFCLSINISVIQAFDSDEFIYGDLVPGAPELAIRGVYQVGVRTLTAVNSNQIDILNYNDNPNKTFQRKLTLEVWYPASLEPKEIELTTYEDTLVSKTPFRFKGRAARNANPNYSIPPSPLVIISHGHPGSRVMMAYLAENLASKGYIVAAIDHTDSTHKDNYTSNIASTLLNRSVDQLFTLDYMDMLNNDKNNFLYQRIDTDNTAIIGYSMGGYGALNSAGAGYSQTFLDVTKSMGVMPDNLLSSRQAGDDNYQASLDDRLKAVILFAPWGGAAALEAQGVPNGIAAWDKAGLAGIKIPSFFISGSEDKVAFYEGGVKSLFDQSINSERYHLIYQNGQHNIAPHPVPPEATLTKDIEHYSESVWDLRRLNNINQHFVTAFLDIYLKGKKSHEYLNLVELSNDGIWSKDKQYNDTEQHTYWKGFSKNSAVGMQLLHKNISRLEPVN